MSDLPAESLEPTFVQGEIGQLFCIKSGPQRHRAKLHSVLLVPPFAEELNTSRRFLALLRRALCNEGYTVIQPDLYGTGDSEGEFAEATWEIWMGDLQNVVQHYCDDSDMCLSVIALRSGCLLAQDFLNIQSQVKNVKKIQTLMYLQPESSGFDVVNTLLRMQAASDRMSGKSSQTTSSMWQGFENGQRLHVGGYDMGHELALQLRESQLVSDANLLVKHQHSVNLGMVSKHESTTGAQREQTIISKPFWQSHDIEPEVSTVETIVALFDG